jgi:DNA-binding GntR family transcriptional regulator
LDTVRPLSAEVKRHAYDHVYRRLRRAVATDQIPSGTRLVETDLANRMEVSRTPIRDALRRLEADGFAERKPGGGLWSRAVTADDIEPLFLVRTELDVLAARLACTAEPNLWAESNTLLAEMADVIARYGRTSPEFGEVHLAFHASIYRVAFGPRFAGLLDNHLLQYLELAADLSYRQPSHAVPPVEQHRVLLEELSSGDIARATAAARAHVQRSHTDAQASYSRMPDSSTTTQRF